MDLVIDKGPLAAALRYAVQSAGVEKDGPQRSAVRLRADAAGRLELCSTDLVRTFEHALTAAVRRPGAVAPDARRLLDRVNALPDGEITLTVDAKLSVQLASGRAKAKLPGLDPADLPSVLRVKGEAVELDVVAFRLAMARCIDAMSNDNTRPHMCALKLGDGTIAAVDGKRLHVSHCGLKLPSVLVPASAALAWVNVLGELKTGSVMLRADRDGVELQSPLGTFSAKAVDASFPMYEQVIPKGHAWRIRVAVEDLRMATRSVGSVRSGHDRGWAVVSFEDGALRFQSEDGETGASADVSVPAQAEKGQMPPTGLVCFQIADAVRHVEGHVLLEGEDALDPVVIRYEDKSFLAVIMPWRVA